jgi:hypothetical protein
VFKEESVAEYVIVYSPIVFESTVPEYVQATGPSTLSVAVQPKLTVSPIEYT